MQRTMIWVAAAALIATPAAAQNDTADANATDMTVENNVAANEMAAMNGMAMAPATNMEVGAPPPEEVAPAPAPVPAPAPARERGFPWGVIGLVGLVGLLGRRRSD